MSSSLAVDTLSANDGLWIVISELVIEEEEQEDTFCQQMLYDFTLQSVPTKLKEALVWKKYEIRYGKLEYWDTSHVTDFSFTFHRCFHFNRPLHRWDTSNAISMESMFNEAYAFNQPLNSWNTSKVTTMKRMFAETRDFNQPLDSWNTSKVIDMDAMFFMASQFNQSLETWDLSSITESIATMFKGSNSFQGLIGKDVDVLRNLPGVHRLFNSIRHIHPFYLESKEKEIGKLTNHIHKLQMKLNNMAKQRYRIPSYHRHRLNVYKEQQLCEMVLRKLKEERNLVVC
jgi:surface protein